MQLPDSTTILQTPAFLKLDLMCRGLVAEEGASAPQIRRTRAGLGSGLELGLPQGVRVNAPVVEPFAAASPYRLRRTATGHAIVSLELPDRAGMPVDVAPVPAFAELLTTTGRPMGRIAVLQGTVLSVYVGPVCGYWTGGEHLQCHFCATGLNVGTSEEADKADDEIVEVAIAARRLCGVTFIHLNMGYSARRETSRIHDLVRKLRARSGLLIGVQCPPQDDVSAYEALHQLGVDHLSFCVEFGDPQWFARLCPGKDATIGHNAYFDAMAWCAKRFRPGAISGEIIAGVEPVAATLAAIDRITALGAFPTVCVFRPLAGTPMRAESPPLFAEMFPVFRHLYQQLVARRVPVGLAPNIHVSIIVTPAEARAFAQPRGFSPAWTAYHTLLAGQRVAGGLYYRLRSRQQG